MTGRDWSTATAAELADELDRRTRLRWALRHPFGGSDEVSFRETFERKADAVLAELRDRAPLPRRLR